MQHNGFIPMGRLGGVVSAMLVLAATTMSPMRTASGMGGNTISSRTQGINVAPARAWTVQEMRQAQPLPTLAARDAPAAAPPALAGQPQVAARQAQGDAGWKPSQPPDGVDSTVVASPETTSYATTTGGYSGQPPYTTHENLGDYTQYPYSTVGKLFFRKGNTRYACTAAVVGEYSVWTAGRCLHTGNGSDDGWYTDVSFVPAYKDGEAPFGVFTAAATSVQTQWFQDGDGRYDSGIVVLGTLGGKSVRQVVGALGFAWNQPDAAAWQQVGYSSQKNARGRQSLTFSSFARTDSSHWGAGPFPVGVGSNLQGDAAGGPWVWNIGYWDTANHNRRAISGAANLLNGNNSYAAPDGGLLAFSPYFGDAAKGLWDCAHASTPEQTLCSDADAAPPPGGAASRAAPAVAGVGAKPTGIPAAGGYWTAERMRDAKPFPEGLLPAAPPAAMPAARPAAQADAIPAAPGWKPSRAPDGQTLPLATAREYPTFAQTTGGYGNHQPPSMTYRLFEAEHTRYPYSTVGKVFFTMTDNNGQSLDYTCSGAVVGEYAVWTAAHCAHDGIKLDTNWVFVPAYWDGTSPYPAPWAAQKVYLHPEFVGLNLRYDMAVVVVSPPPEAQGHSLAHYTGSLGFAWDQPLAQHWMLAGYPSAVYGGKSLILSAGSYAASDDYYTGVRPIGVGSKLKGGGKRRPVDTAPVRRQRADQLPERGCFLPKDALP